MNEVHFNQVLKVAVIGSAARRTYEFCTERKEDKLGRKIR